MPATINDIQPITTEIVLSERLVSTEFVITDIHEQISNRQVRAEVELGPFTEDTRPGGEISRRGATRRGIMVWQNEEYDAIRDTWTNADLLAVVKAKLENS